MTNVIPKRISLDDNAAGSRTPDPTFCLSVPALPSQQLVYKRGTDQKRAFEPVRELRQIVTCSGRL